MVRHGSLKFNFNVFPLQNFHERRTVQTAAEHLLDEADRLGNRDFFNKANIDQLIAYGRKRRNFGVVSKLRGIGKGQDESFSVKRFSIKVYFSLKLIELHKLFHYQLPITDQASLAISTKLSGHVRIKANTRYVDGEPAID